MDIHGSVFELSSLFCVLHSIQTLVNTVVIEKYTTHTNSEYVHLFEEQLCALIVVCGFEPFTCFYSAVCYTKLKPASIHSNPSPILQLKVNAYTRTNCLF